VDRDYSERRQEEKGEAKRRSGKRKERSGRGNTTNWKGKLKQTVNKKKNRKQKERRRNERDPGFQVPAINSDRVQRGWAGSGGRETRRRGA
jgi:hypothetical protein